MTGSALGVPTDPAPDRYANMSIIPLLLYICCVSAGDPMQNMIRDVILSIRSVGERFISSIPLSSATNVMYQLDPKATQAIGSLADFINVCPPSIALPSVAGFWQITHVSRQALLGIFTEIEQLIDRVSIGGPAYVPKNLGDLLRTGEFPHCMTVSVLSQPVPVPFEYSYGSAMGRRSIIGTLTTTDGRHLSFNFGGDVEFRTTLVYASPSDDILVMADLDAIPKCSNIMVMRRNQSYEGRLPFQLASQGSSPPSNPLINIPCP